MSSIYGVQERLRVAVESGVTPGAALSIVRRDTVPQVIAIGNQSYAGVSVSKHTIYDLASLTKVVATLPSILRLVADREVNLDHRVSRFFRGGTHSGLGSVTIHQLLTHTGGLPAWAPIYEAVVDREDALGVLLRTDVQPPGAVRYSDLGFMLLGAIIERIAGEQLDTFATREVFEPLEMTQTTFGPVAKSRVAPTEYREGTGALMQGEVHDENAAAWGGVSGHAGLFSTVSDLARYAQAWLTKDPRIAPEALMEVAMREQTINSTRPRGLGWLLAYPGWFGGLPHCGFGHTGFTGTSVFIDPGAGLSVILLTNRIHPRRGSVQGVKQLRESIHAHIRDAEVTAYPVRIYTLLV